MLALFLPTSLLNVILSLSLIVLIITKKFRTQSSTIDIVEVKNMAEDFGEKKRVCALLEKIKRFDRK